jgi:hypothetical protein
MSVLVTSQKEIDDAPYYVLSNDRLMSYWGKSEGRINVCILPCESYEEAEKVAAYAESRSDQERVRIVGQKPRLNNSTHTYSLMLREQSKAWYTRRGE